MRSRWALRQDPRDSLGSLLPQMGKRRRIPTNSAGRCSPTPGSRACAAPPTPIHAARTQDLGHRAVVRMAYRFDPFALSLALEGGLGHETNAGSASRRHSRCGSRLAPPPSGSAGALPSIRGATIGAHGRETLAARWLRNRTELRGGRRGSTRVCEPAHAAAVGRHVGRDRWERLVPRSQIGPGHHEPVARGRFPDPRNVFVA